MRAKKSKVNKKAKKIKGLKWWYSVPVVLLIIASGYLVVRFGQAATRRIIYRRQDIQTKYVFPLNYTKAQLAFGNGEGYFWECINERKGKSCGLSHPYPAMDIFAPTGTEVVAVIGGVVNSARASGCTRNCNVVIKGDDGLYYLYAHLLPGSVFAAKGLRVKTGQYLGKIGTAKDAINTATGRGTTPHLHFDIRRNPNAICNRGNPDSPGCASFVDPRPILFQGYAGLLYQPIWNF